MKKTILLNLLFVFTLVLNAQSERFPHEAGTTRIMSYNVRNGKGLDNVTDLKRTAEVIRSVAPDVVSVQELDSVTERSKQVDVLKELATLTNMHYVYGAAIDYDGGKYGLGILSKEQPLSYKNVALPGREEKRTLLIAEFKNYVLFATHWSLTQADRQTSVAIANTQAKRFNKPVFCVGDFNAEPSAPEMKHMIHFWKMLNDSQSPTFPADKPTEHIDHIFGFRASGLDFDVSQALVIDEPLVSDHRPLFVDVSVKKVAIQKKKAKAKTRKGKARRRR